MKLLCLTISLVSAFTVEPWPDSQHSIIAEKPQIPEFTVGPDDSEETTLITDEPPLGPGIDIGPDDSEERTLITDGQLQGPGLTLETEQSKGNSIISEAQLFDLEEEKGQSEPELRGSGCKAKLSCSILGGYCVDNATLCNPGRLVPAGCKGNCQCCIPVGDYLCPEEKGYFRSPGSNQCFKLVTDRYLNWTDSVAYCKANGMVLAHPYDAVSLRDYIVERFGYSYPWLNARGTGSYMTWQDNTHYRYIRSYDALWYTGHPGSRVSSSYCLKMLAHPYYRNITATQPYLTWGCSGRNHALCQVVL